MKRSGNGNLYDLKADEFALAQSKLLDGLCRLLRRGSSLDSDSKRLRLPKDCVFVIIVDGFHFHATRCDFHWGVLLKGLYE